MLDEAVQTASIDSVRWLLDKGANPNTLFFQDKPCGANQKRKEGLYFSPFATAISNGKTEIVLLMLSRGADLNLPTVWCGDDDFQTCRDVAMESAVWSRIEAQLVGNAVPTVMNSGAARRI